MAETIPQPMDGDREYWRWAARMYHASHDVRPGECGEAKIIRLLAEERRLREQAEARVKELEAVREWRPISTVPKDGTNFLLLFRHEIAEHGTYVVESWWDSKEGMFLTAIGCDPIEGTPLQWHPRPLAPAEPKETTDGR